MTDQLLQNVILEALGDGVDRSADELSAWLHVPLATVRVALADLFFKQEKITCVPQIRGEKKGPVRYRLGDPTRLIEMPS